MSRPVIGLALGAGAMRGMAHIGVLQVLEREGLRVDQIAGTSIGAVVGGLYAAGKSPDELADIAMTLQEIAYYDLTLPRMGLLAGKRVQNLLREYTQEQTFADTRIPFAAVACALADGAEHVFDKGPLHEAIRASISLPGVFVPAEVDGVRYIDGGIKNRIPVSVLQKMGAQRVIAVDVGYRGQKQEPKNLVEVLMHAYDILEWQVAQQRMSHADLLLSPDVRTIHPAHLTQAEACIAAGRRATEDALPALRALYAEV